MRERGEERGEGEREGGGDRFRFSSGILRPSRQWAGGAANGQRNTQLTDWKRREGGSEHMCDATDGKKGESE